MNIGIFTDTYYPEINGVVTSIKVLENELKNRGHKVYIFTTSNPLNTETKFGVIRLPSIPFVFFNSRRIGLFYSNKIANLVRKLKLDLVHTHTEFSLGILGKFVARQVGIPIIHTYHTLYKDYMHYISKDKFKNFSDNVVKLYTRRYCNTCNGVIVPTGKVYDLLRGYSVTKPIEIIPTGIEVNNFLEEYSEIELSNLKKSLGIHSKDKIILFIGRVAKEKSIDLIIKQMPQILEFIPNCKFLIVGGGPLERDLKKLAKQLQIEKSIIFAGEQPFDQVGKFYAIGNVFISASITETQGLTIAEAMASKIPVIVRRDENIEGFILNYSNGLVFSSNKEMVNAVVELLTNEKLCQKIKINAARTIKEYSSQKFCERVETFYVRAMEREDAHVGEKICRE